MEQIHLSIPQPCHENWDAMTPNDRGRHCTACATTVIDFTTMSDAEALLFFTKEKKTNTCGRVLADQLNRNIIPVQKKRTGYRNYFAGVLLLLLGKPTETKSQKRPIRMGLVTNVDQHIGRPDTVARAIPFNKYVFNGTVQDEDGQPVRFAVIKMFDTGEAVTANASRHFNMNISEYPFVAEVSANSFETKQITISNNDDNIIQLKKATLSLKQLTEKVGVLSSLNEVVAVAGGISVCRTKKKVFFADTMQRIQHYFSSNIKVYPNPVKAGSVVTIQLKLKQTGSYGLRITSITGTDYLVKQIKVTGKNHHEQLPTQHDWPSGIYFIQLTDDSGKNCGTGKFVVE